MPRLLALDWTRHEARYVLASGGNDKLSVISAGAFDLSELSDEEYADPRKLGEALNAHLSTVKPGRAATLVGIDRPLVELMEFTVPSVPEAELPQMVLNLAIRESAAVTDESAIDFISVPNNMGDGHQVTAVALSPDELQKLQSTCEAAKLSPQRMLLRAYATAGLLSAEVGNMPRRCMLVNCLGDDADLTVVESGHVSFSRTVKLSNQDDQDATNRRLVQEIRRTMMVAPHSQTDAVIEAIYVLGRDDENRNLLNMAREEFSTIEDEASDESIRVESLDVFAAVGAADDIVTHDSGRFGPLLGMLWTESHAGEHTFDFLNPRKPPEPPNRRRMMAIVGSLVATAAIFLGYTTWSDLAEATSENDKLAAELSKMKSNSKKIKEQKAIAAAIAGWESRGVNWLEELQTFSEKFPSARDAMVLRMSLTPSRSGGGSITLSGLARDPTVVTNMELSLRDDTHEVETPRVQERAQENGYAWHFDTKINISQAKPDSDKKSDQEQDDKASSGKKPSKKKTGAKSTKPESKTAKKVGSKKSSKPEAAKDRKQVEQPKKTSTDQKTSQQTREAK